MASPSQSIIQYVADNWSRTPINYASFNVNFDPKITFTGYTDNDSWLAPSVTMVLATGVEIPVESGVRKEQYQLFLNIVTNRFVGDGTINDHFDALKVLLDRKTITTGGHVFYFDSMEARRAFVVYEKYEMPVEIDFFVYRPS